MDLFHCLRRKLGFTFPEVYLADFYETFYMYPTSSVSMHREECKKGLPL